MLNFTLSKIFWILAQPFESQTESCKRENLLPLPSSYIEELIPSFQWNQTTVKDIVEEQLGYVLFEKGNEEGLTGLYGCCASGLWCTPSDRCFTQRFGRLFDNYGWLSSAMNNTINSEFIPVYSCYKKDQPEQILSASITLIGKHLKILGRDIASRNQTNSVVATVYGEQCSNYEFYNYQECGDHGEICERGSTCSCNGNDDCKCFKTCANGYDTSCPRGFHCKYLKTYQKLRNQDYEIVKDFYICTPSGKVNTDIIQCDVSRAFQQQYIDNRTGKFIFSDYVLKINDVNTILDINISLAIGNKSITKKNNFGTSFGFCEIDSDCYDGNMCTLDVCNVASKLCEYTSSLGCTSNPTIYRSTFKANAIVPFLYKSFTFLENEHILSNFTHTVLKAGTKSTSSDLDDNPGRNYDLLFSFDFFGNKVKQIAIDPNGIIHLPPTDRCIESKCYPFTSYSNIIAPWYADWDPSMSEEAEIYVLEQVTGDGK